MSTALEETQDVLVEELSGLAHAELLIPAALQDLSLASVSAWHKLLWVLHLQTNKKDIIWD